MMFEEVRGKTALVTGATSGIGWATCRLLGRLGARVVLAGRDKQRGKELETKLVSEGSEALFVRTDVASLDSVKNLIQVTEGTYGSIHYALNNAGIEGNLGPIGSMSEGDFDEVIATNLKGVWLCLKFQLAAMAAEGASIVNISTNITRVGMPETGAYTASKAGVESLTRVAAIENGKRGVRINAISPGAVNTPMIHRIYPEKDDLSKVSQGNPLGKMAKPEDIANTALWLFSSMSAHVNGDVVFVDGGSSIAG